MAPLPNVPGVAQVRVSIDLATHVCENVFHFSFGGSASNADMAQIALQVWDGYASTWSAGGDWISSDAILKIVTATDLTTPTSAFGFYDNGGTPLPGDATQQSSAQRAMLISKQVDRRYRGGHGRTYLVGFTDDNNLDGRLWKPTATAQALSMWQTVRNNVFTGTYPNITDLDECIVSYYDRALNPVPPYRRAVPLVSRVSEYKIDPVQRSQRRRVRNTPSPS